MSDRDEVTVAFLYLWYITSYPLISNSLSMQKDSDLLARFNKAIQNDNPSTKLWKYRHFLSCHPKQAVKVKDKMLQLALKHRLIGEYETIFAISGVKINNIPRTGEYNRLKEDFQTALNKLKIEASQYEQVDKVEEEVKTYFKIGQLSAEFGDHQESELFYSKILRKQSGAIYIRDEDYLARWGRELFYLVQADPQSTSNENRSYQDLEFFSVRSFQDEKKINSTLALVRDIYRLTRKGRGKGRVKVLENILAPHFSMHDVLSNGIFNLNDLGFLYSLLVLAFKDRQSIKKHVKWSSKVQTAYLQSDYKKLFSELRRNYESFGYFNPTIAFVFEECNTLIRNRVFQEIFNAYESVPLDTVAEKTGFRRLEVELFVKDNPELPYLIDPIAQSVVFYEKSIPLYQEALTYFGIVQEKYNSKERMLIDDSREDIDLDELEDRGGRRRGLGMFGPLSFMGRQM